MDRPPQYVRDILLDHLCKLAEAESTCEVGLGFEARMLRTAKIIEILERRGDVTLQRLNAIENFLVFCRGVADQPTMEAVSGMVGKYIDSLRSEAAAEA